MRSEPAAAVPDLDRRSAGDVTADQVFAHLHALQEIINAKEIEQLATKPGWIMSW
ncbi:hypothetical protein [Mycobacterium uberis]|uniref:hypothetical protein n=1 Tax=Mycobacterium uberis TaxID=2162698 RepID=UPI001402B9CE|nr:hypothetical protein [Mycobacterium uberis]